MNEEMQTKLEKLAHEKTIPFCYMCYIDAPSGVCSECHSDDLMRHLPGVGVEYGYHWVIDSLLRENLNEADISESFDEMLESCYEETSKIGFISVSTVQALKKLDPIAYDIAKDDYVSSLIEDEELIEFEGRYYNKSDVEHFLKEGVA